MKVFFLVCAFIAGIPFYAQTDTKQGQVSDAEWDTLDATFVAFIQTLQKEDKAGFKKISLPQVECIDCVGKPEFNGEGYFVPADIFFLNVAKNFTKSPVYKALAKRGYTFSIAEIKNFKPKFFPKNYPNNLFIYEVWVPTYLKNELSQGHPGASHAFQFVKINGEFRFYGLMSIP
ncbi:hypothetical protein [Flavobacterium rhizosphaerae]|uniref:Uncharacterized protein n=1 Tax=Flavobacterium rhizosphaerae TaxID=3163298 RepID=A0ABW8YW17_9FLAO